MPQWTRLPCLVATAIFPLLGCSGSPPAEPGASTLPVANRLRSVELEDDQASDGVEEAAPQEVTEDDDPGACAGEVEDEAQALRLVAGLQIYRQWKAEVTNPVKLMSEEAGDDGWVVGAFEDTETHFHRLGTFRISRDRRVWIWDFLADGYVPVK